MGKKKLILHIIFCILSYYQKIEHSTPANSAAMFDQVNN